METSALLGKNTKCHASAALFLLLSKTWVDRHLLFTNKLGSRRCLSIGYIIIGILKKGMDLVNYVKILGKHIFEAVGKKK